MEGANLFLLDTVESVAINLTHGDVSTFIPAIPTNDFAATDVLGISPSYLISTSFSFSHLNRAILNSCCCDRTIHASVGSDAGKCDSGVDSIDEEQIDPGFPPSISLTNLALRNKEQVLRTGSR